MKNVVPEIKPHIYPRIKMNQCQLYLAQNKTNGRPVTAIRLNREIAIVGTGGVVFMDSHSKYCEDKFQDMYTVIRPLDKGEQVVLEV